MVLRTTTSSVTFKAPFKLAELDEVQPPGTYKVVTDEEIIEGNERNVYIRVATLLYVQSGGTTRVVTVDRNALQVALAQDGNQ